MICRSFASIFLAVMVSLPAAAQPVSEVDLGSHIARPAPARLGNRSLNEEQRGRDIMNKFARCAIDRNSKTISTAIRLEPGPDGPFFAKAATSDCLDSGSLKSTAAIMRGAVFSELSRRAMKNGGSQLVGFPARPVDLQQLPSTENKPATTLYYLLWVSDCLAKTNRSSMETIVTSSTASQAQQAAYAAIIPAIGPCIYEGSTFAVSRAVLEAGFGEYLYRSLPAAAER